MFKIFWKFLLQTITRKTTTDSGRYPLTTINILHNKGQFYQHSWWVLPPLEPLTSSPLSWGRGGVNSGSHSPNNAHQYLLNIALCPPRVKGIALNRQRLQRRSGHQCSPLLRILLFSQTFNTYCSGLPSRQVSGAFFLHWERKIREFMEMLHFLNAREMIFRKVSWEWTWICERVGPGSRFNDVRVMRER